MLSRSIAFATLLAGSLLSPGCVGFVALGTDTITELPAPAARAGDGLGILRADELLAWRGEPDERVRVSETTEDWVYDGGTRWSGVVVFVVVPVPLLAPLSSLDDTYHLDDGVARAVERRVRTESGAIWGFVGHDFGGRTFTTRAAEPLPRRAGASDVPVAPPPIPAQR